MRALKLALVAPVALTGGLIAGVALAAITGRLWPVYVLAVAVAVYGARPQPPSDRVGPNRGEHP